MAVIWGNTELAGISPSSLGSHKTQAELVVSATSDRVVALGLYPAETWLSTYYPKAGIAYSTRHKDLTMGALGYVATATTYTLRCDFSEFAP